jgi:hypothetical protein
MHEAAVAASSAAAAQPLPGARSAAAAAANRVGSLLSGWRDDTADAANNNNNNNHAAPSAAPRDVPTAPPHPPLARRPPETCVPPSAELARAVEARRRFQALVVHRVSLMHALALQSLRCAACLCPPANKETFPSAPSHPIPNPNTARQPLLSGRLGRSGAHLGSAARRTKRRFLLSHRTRSPIPTLPGSRPAAPFGGAFSREGAERPAGGLNQPLPLLLHLDLGNLSLQTPGTEAGGFCIRNKTV